MITAAIEFFNFLINGDTLIVLAGASGLGYVARGYFKSKAVDGKLTGEDWIFVGVATLFGAVIAFGIWKGLS